MKQTTITHEEMDKLPWRHIELAWIDPENGDYDDAEGWEIQLGDVPLEAYAEYHHEKIYPNPFLERKLKEGEHALLKIPGKALYIYWATMAQYQSAKRAIEAGEEHYYLFPQNVKITDYPVIAYALVAGVEEVLGEKSSYQFPGVQLIGLANEVRRKCKRGGKAVFKHLEGRSKADVICALMLAYGLLTPHCVQLNLERGDIRQDQAYELGYKMPLILHARLYKHIKSVPL